MAGQQGACASGHQLVTTTALDVLEAGGNVFDAAVGAMAVSCVVEPLLSGLGGGGVALVVPSVGKSKVLNFFCQTPQIKPSLNEAQNLDFHPIVSPFGVAKQSYHIGTASIATPGVVAGLFALHGNGGFMPLKEVLAPAINLARQGVELNMMQGDVLKAMEPIVRASPQAQALYTRKDVDGRALQVGDVQVFSEMANLLESLAYEGPRLFYEGEVALAFANLCQAGGLLTRRDFEDYHVLWQDPVALSCRQVKILTAGVPFLGGVFANICLELMAAKTVKDLSQTQWYTLFAHSLVGTHHLRKYPDFDTDPQKLIELLKYDGLAQALQDIKTKERALKKGGTTHLSLVDKKGDMISVTLTNGEGSGSIVPGCGFMPNNMLGEAALNAQGLFDWRADTRLLSMMGPTTLMWGQGKRVAFGTGGGNRISAALAGVMSRIIFKNESLEQAIIAPRIHMEGAKLYVEGGLNQETYTGLRDTFKKVRFVEGKTLFFGGVHGVGLEENGNKYAITDDRGYGVGMRFE